jgi:protein CpxP
MNDTPSTSNQAANGNRQRWAMGALIAAASASVVISLSAWAGSEHREGGTPMHGMHGEHGDMGAGPGGFGGFGGRHLQHLLDEAKATDAQRTQINAIADKAQADLKTLHEQGRSLHEQGLKLWAAPKLDAAAAEKLRQHMLAHHDQVSKRAMQAMLDVGAVLTPEQRATIGEQMQKRHEGMIKRMQERLGMHHEAGPDGDHDQGHRQEGGK